MGRSVRIPEEHARSLSRDHRQAYDSEDREPWQNEAINALDSALARLDRIPKRKPRQTLPLEIHVPGSGWVKPRAPRKPSKEEKRDRRASIREKVFARAGGQCEGPGGSNPLFGGRCLNPATDLQHVFGRGKGRMPESERNCLAACRTCHEAEGRNIPSSAAWWTWFGQWFQQHGFTEEAARARSRARFDDVRATSPAAPRTR